MVRLTGDVDVDDDEDDRAGRAGGPLIFFPTGGPSAAAANTAARAPRHEGGEHDDGSSSHQVAQAGSRPVPASERNASRENAESQPGLTLEEGKFFFISSFAVSFYCNF